MTVKVTQVSLNALVVPADGDTEVQVSNFWLEVLSDAPPSGQLHFYGVQFSDSVYDDADVVIQPGDRGAFDVHQFPLLHASDIAASAPIYHNPVGSASGQAPVWDGAKYVATDIATQAELDAHTALANPHATDLLDLGDTPGSYSGQAQKILKVNATEDGVELAVRPDDKIITLGTAAGDLQVETNPLRIYNRYGGSRIIQEVFIAVNTAPTGAAIIVDVLLNGTTIFALPADRPTIADAANTGSSTTIGTSTWAVGDYIQFDIAQIGSTTPGADLTVHIVTTPGTYT